MTDANYNPNDIEFLISRDIDGDLSSDEQRLLQERLAQSPLLREEAARLRNVAGIISRWSEDRPSVDWVSQAKLVQARLNEPIEGADQRLDHMLRGWAAERPAMDEAALVAGVMSQIRVPRRRALYPMLRIGAPLAAAAVLVFSLSTFLWTRPQAAPTWLVDIHRPVSSSVTGSDVIVSFVREVEIVEEPVEASSIAFLTLGAVPAVPSGEAPL